MTRKAVEGQIRLVQMLHGQRCSQIAIGEDDELIVDFGELLQVAPGDHDGESWLIVECPWRLDSDDEVLCGWDDADETITASIAELLDSALVDSRVRLPGFDLILTFDTGEYQLYLKLFPDCLAYFVDDTTTLSIPWYAGGKAIEKA